MKGNKKNAIKTLDKAKQFLEDGVQYNIALIQFENRLAVIEIRHPELKR